MADRSINSEKAYRDALERAAVLMDARARTRQAVELERLAERIEAYEREHYPIARPKPDAALRFRAEQLGYSVHKVTAALEGDRMLYKKAWPTARFTMPGIMRGKSMSSSRAMMKVRAAKKK